MYRFNKECRIFISSLHKSCENSSHLLSRIRKFFEINNYVIVSDIKKSDVILLNTCIAMDEIIEKNEIIINRMSDSYNKKIIIFGCLPAIIEKIKDNDQITMIKFSDIDTFSELFENTIPISSISVPNLFDFIPYQPKINENDSFVHISHGCSNSCSYCNTKIAKGGVKSRPFYSIKNDFIDLVRAGRNEITILSDDCGSYGNDINTNIADLICDLLKIDRKIKIKIYTIYPGMLLKYYSKMKDSLFDGSITYMCIPVQSGSNRILRLMNRNYDLVKLEGVLREIKKNNQNIHLFSHFIVNFPTETIEDFKKSLDYAKLFDSVLFITFSDNSRTKSSKIYPKCNDRDLKRKMKLLNKFLENKDIIGNVVYGKN